MKKYIFKPVISDNFKSVLTAVKDYKALEPFRKYPQRIINVTNKFIKGKMHALRDYVDGYEDAKQQLSQK